MSAHKERAHARLSASGSKRWMSCTPSARLEESFSDSTSSFAEEGTFAHELSELLLADYMQSLSGLEVKKRMNKMKKNQYYSEELFDYVKSYTDYVIERVHELEAQFGNSTILLEKRLDFSEWVPEGFGTGDVILLAGNVMEIIDLKYGKGVPVFAEENSQMRLYALGAINDFGFLYDIEEVRMTIVQPRLDSVSTDTFEAQALLDWAEDEVKPKAEMADRGEGEYVPGEHCRFCRARAVCRARAEENLKLAAFDFAEPPRLSDEEIAEIMVKADDLAKWAKDVSEYAFDQAVNHGKKFPGYKLVEGRSNRRYKDPSQVLEKLKLEGFDEKVVTKTELLTLTNLEKAIGKKLVAEHLSDLIEKPNGKATLVPESDKRKEINSVSSAIADFE